MYLMWRRDLTHGISSEDAMIVLTYVYTPLTMSSLPRGMHSLYRPVDVVDDGTVFIAYKLEII